jgi:uncharacterized protein (DUF433 family)
MLGKPVISGLTVESILDRLGADESVESLLEAHPVQRQIVTYLRECGHRVVYAAD